jgi:hypothetical protein
MLVNVEVVVAVGLVDSVAEAEVPGPDDYADGVSRTVAVISVDNDAAEVELVVALSTALLGCKVDCGDIKISTGIAVVISALRLAGSVSLGLAYGT